MDRYPVDDIRDKTNCELHQSMKNISMKVEVDFALPCEPGVPWHGREIRDGYDHVKVDEVVLRYEYLDLASLDLKRRQHLEKSWVVLLYGIRKTLCFQARCQGGHPLLQVVAIHHLQVHPSTTIGTTTTSRVHLYLRLCFSRLYPLISPRGNIIGSLLLCRVVLPL
jgi:hypothetical protein